MKFKRAGKTHERDDGWPVPMGMQLDLDEHKLSRRRTSYNLSVEKNLPILPVRLTGRILRPTHAGCGRPQSMLIASAARAKGSTSWDLS
jgi:hypothetical protein